MSTVRKMAAASCALLTLALGACADMSRQQKDTAIGAGVGGVAGSVLTNGSTTGTLGGAAIGGVIGNQTGKGK
jgi:osmotically inducible lipoprotein OsmB